MDVVTLALAKSGAKTYTDTKLGSITTNVTYKGHVASQSELPASPSVGDEYDVGTTGLWVYNGSSWTRANQQGATGETGAAGAAAGFGTPSATIDANVGTPQVTVTASGPDTAKVFAFDFKNLKGESGAHSVSVSSTGTSTDKVKYITIDGTESKMAVDVINNVTSTSTDDALSANMGKELQDQISNLKNIGRFLAILDCSAGSTTSEPTTSPYSYKVGDYYRVGVAGSYEPNPAKSTYTTGASDNFVSGSQSFGIGDVIYCSNIAGTTSTWVKQGSSGGGTVQDVQVNSTSVLSGGIANIPNSSASTSGVMTAAQYTKLDGIETGAQVNTVTSVDGSTGVITLSDVKYTSQSLTTAQQSQARTNIGAVALAEYDSSATPAANTLYWVEEDD